MLLFSLANVVVSAHGPHPLRSELNFPMGTKSPIDFAPERWEIAIHALDAIFQHTSSSLQGSGRAGEVLRENGEKGLFGEPAQCGSRVLFNPLVEPPRPLTAD